MVKKPNPELVKYIEKHLLKGYKLKQVKRKLAEVGHPIEAIEDAASFVLSSKPHLKRRDWKFTIIYGLILIVVLAGFVYYIATKTTEQIEYKQTVKEIKQKNEYLSMTDVDLIKMAAAGDMKACDFVTGHNMKYACLDKYWEKDDCSYEALIGEEIKCWFEKAIESENWYLCYNIDNVNKSLECRDMVFSIFVRDESPEKCGSDNSCLLNYINNKGIENLGVDFCEQTPIGFKDDCLRIYFDKTGDSTACDLMYNQSNIFDCWIGTVGSFEGSVELCKNKFDVFIQSFKEENIDTDFAKAVCFLYVAQHVMDAKDISCRAFLDFVDNNLNSDIVRAFSETYKYHKNNPEEFKETFFECD